MDDVAARLALVRRRIAEAASRSGRPGEVTLVAVTKSVELERIRGAFAAGQRVFGENRVQEAVVKVRALPDAAWHLIGHLQTNKVHHAVEAFSLIQSVDSLRLAAKLNLALGRVGTTMPVLFEVNVGGESSKHGFEPAQFQEALPQLLSLSHLEPRGLMTIAPPARDPEEVRPIFRALREIRDGVREAQPLPRFADLSMGMTDDFEVAVEEGATIVRIGRAIFGEREPTRTG